MDVGHDQRSPVDSPPLTPGIRWDVGCVIGTSHQCMGIGLYASIHRYVYAYLLYAYTLPDCLYVYVFLIVFT